MCLRFLWSHFRNINDNEKKGINIIGSEIESYKINDNNQKQEKVNKSPLYFTRSIDNSKECSNCYSIFYSYHNRKFCSNECKISYNFRNDINDYGSI